MGFGFDVNPTKAFTVKQTAKKLQHGNILILTVSKSNYELVS